MVCEAAASLMLAYLDELLEHISEPDFQGAYRESSGLCLGHFRKIAARHPHHANLRILAEIQIAKYRSLAEELGEFLRKFDYRFTQEPMGGEADSWRRAIELFVGKPGTSGNDLALEDQDSPPSLRSLVSALYRLCRRCLGFDR
jgi:hypothetical protein